jgi:hypothetical protein
MLQKNLLRFWLILIVFGSVGNVWGQQFSITGTGAGNTYTQNFDGFAGTLATLPTNWSWSFNDYNPGGFYNRNGTYNNTNSTYALRDNPSSTDNAFGGKIDGSTYQLVFSTVNNTGATITGFTITTNVEQYSTCTNGTPVSFTYSIGGGTYGTSGASGTTIVNATTGTCANLGSITTTSLSITISSITVNNGQTVDFRFSIGNGTSFNSHIGVDDFTVFATAACTPPTTQASSFSVSNQMNTSMDVNWVRGTGSNVLVVARQGSAVNANPSSGTTYTANAAFGSGDQIGTGNFVVYNGPATSVNVTGLSAGLTYHYAVYEYNTSGVCYLTPGLLGNGTTTSPPPVITHTGTSPAASNVLQNTLNNILYQTQIDIATAGTTLTQVVTSTSGTWISGDVVNFKLWYSTDATLTGTDATLATISTGLTGGALDLSFTGLSQSIPTGTVYLFVTCDVSATATIGNTVIAASDADGDFSYSNSPTFSGSSFAAGNAITIIGAPEIQLQYPIATNVNCGFSLNFGNVNIGSSNSLTVRIQNIGTANLDLSSLPLTASGDYTITTQPSSPIAAGGSSDVTIQFTPTLGGTRTSSVSIANNDANENPCGINLTGVGVVPPYHYRTVQSGDFTLNSTWESSLDNMTWAPAISTPTSSDLSITIRSPHVISVTTLSVDDMTIENGATLDITSGTLTVANGAAAIDLSVAGILKNAGTITATGVIRVENGGLYQHNPASAGSVPSITWATGSTCEIIRANGAPGNLNQAYYNFIWNSSTHDAGTINLSSSLKTVNNDLSVLLTGTGALRLAGSTTNTLAVGGNVTIAAGTIFDLGNGNAVSTVDINGNLTLAGTLNLMGSGSNAGIVNLKGNLIGTGSTITVGTTTNTACKLNFNGATQQTASFGTISNRVNIDISNAQGVSLGSGLTMASSSVLTLVSGKLILNEFNLNLSSSGTSISGATSSNYIQTNSTGALRRTVAGTAVAFPVGNSSYNPVTLTNTGSSDIFSASVSDAVLSEGTTGTELGTDVVDRTWTVNENTNGGSNVTMLVQWASADELPSFNPSSCYISHHNGTNWLGATPSAASGSGPFTQTRSGLTSFSPFAVGSNSVLPVTLTQWSARATGTQTQLTFSTASEHNNDYFAIERSNNALDFVEIGRVKGAGNSSSLLKYQYTDDQPLSGTNYYRLRQMDFDGKFSLSQVISVYFESGRRIVLAPSPAIDRLQIQLDEAPDTDASWWLYDYAGRLIQSGTWAAETKQFDLDLLQMPSGTYVFRLQLDQEVLTKQFWKE